MDNTFNSQNTPASIGTNVSAFLVGIGIGALVGILFAPKTGNETREFLTQKAESGKEYAQRKARELRDRATDMVDHSKDAVTRELDSIVAAVDAGRQAYYQSKPNGSAIGGV